MRNKLYWQFAGSCFLLVFVFLGYVVKFFPQWLTGFDTFLTNILRSPYPAWNEFYLTITKLGNPLFVVAIGLVLVALMALGKRYAESLWYGIGLVGVAGIGNALLKLGFLRQRPTLEHLVEETSFSFPSGHATGSMILFGTLCFILPGLIKNKPVRLLLQVLCGSLILGIGISRIYLGVHFPTDIIGGFCLGAGWLCLTYPIFAERRFVWRFTGKQR